MRLLLPLAALLLVVVARNLPHHHKAHKRHVDRANEDALRALQDEELRAWEDDQRVRRQLANSDMAAEEKMRLAEEHWQKFSQQRRRGGCKGRYRPAPPGQIRRRCPPRARTPHDRVNTDSAQYPASGYTYYPAEITNNYDASVYEAERAEHEARLRQYEAERAAAEAARALYEQQYREAELKRAEEEERYRQALLERKMQEEESARTREEEERRYNELNEQRQREYEDMLRKHREQHEIEQSSRRRAPCPALRHDILDGKTYEQIFLFAHKSGCSEDETRTAIDMARRQRIEQYALKYAYPVLFYSRTRGWIKINNEPERLRFEEQEADLDFERLRAQYNFVQEIEAARPHPQHPPAYTEEELERSRKLAEVEKESFNVIDKDNNEAVSYGNEEEKPETEIDAIVLPQDEDEEDTVEEEPKPAPTLEELEELEREKEARDVEKDELINAVLEEMKNRTEEEGIALEEEKLKQEEEEKARIAEKLEKELREAERVEKEEKDRIAEELKEVERVEKEKKEEEEREEKERLEREEKERLEKEEDEKKAKEEEAAKPVVKELPDEEETVVVEEERNEEEGPEEIKVEDPIPVIPDIGDEVIVEQPEAKEETKEEEGAEVNIPVLEPKPESEPIVIPEKPQYPKAEGQALDMSDDPE